MSSTIAFAAIAVVALAAVAFAIYVKIAKQRGETARNVAARGNLVVLMGPNGAGKTVLFHQLSRGVLPETISSVSDAKFAGLLKSSDGSAEGPEVTLLDVPGFPQHRERAVEMASRAAGIVFVLNAAAEHNKAAPTTHFKAAADLLYELFTSAAAVDKGAPLLIVCNKMDAPGARTIDAVKAILEEELELLKVSRPSIRLLGDSAAGALQPLLLGQEGRRFRFADDCPLPLSWCGCVATAPASPSAGKSAEGSKASTATVKSSAGPGMDDVRAFIASAVERR